VLIVILGLMTPALNGSTPNQTSWPIDVVRILDSVRFCVTVRTAEIPRLPLVSAKIIRSNQSVSQALVDPGKPYQSGDNIEGDYPPSRQLVFAGISPEYILICFSKGGMGVSKNMLLLHRTANKWVAVFAAILNETKSVKDIEGLKKSFKHGDVIPYSSREEDWTHN
jgi:hypothetical protein